MWQETGCLLLLKWVIKYSFEDEKRGRISQVQGQPLTHLSPCSKTFLVLSSFVVFQRLLALWCRQATVFWITCVLWFCVQQGEGAAKPPHPLDSDTNLKSSSKSHMTALNYWDPGWFRVRVRGCTAEILSFCIILSSHWAGKGEDKSFALYLEVNWKGVGLQSHVHALLNSN